MLIAQKNQKVRVFSDTKGSEKIKGVTHAFPKLNQRASKKFGGIALEPSQENPKVS